MEQLLALRAFGTNILHARSRHWWPESGALNPIPSLDGLRAIAVLLTMIFHSWWGMPGSPSAGDAKRYAINYGRTGVHLFFVLSGFLLFLPYARHVFDLQPRPSARLFYKRRALRVGPAYWVSLAILLIGAPFTLTKLADACLHVLFASNLAGFSTYSINGVFWTMAIEVQFYVILPLLGVIVYWVSRRVHPLLAVGALAIMLEGVSLFSGELMNVGRLMRIPVVSTALIADTGLPHWLGVFGGGIACSVLYTYLTMARQSSPAQVRVISRFASCIALASVCLAIALAFVPALQRLSINGVLYGWAYTGVLFGLLFGAPLLRRPFESRPLRFIGLISYSLYIWHTVVMGVIASHLRGIASLDERVIIGFVLELTFSIPVAYVSFQLTESPFMHARRRAHEKAPTAVHSPLLAPIEARA